MKQHEAVILTLERLGGQATLAELYRGVMKIKECNWETKTPFASIRRIVQTRPEIFKVRPGLWALRSHQANLGLSEYSKTKQLSPEVIEQSHSYYQGLLVVIGNLRGFSTYVPGQDKNRLFVNKPLKDLRSLQMLPAFSHDVLVKRSSTVDVIWFNTRLMPNSLFEVEHSTDIQNSLLKFHDLQDFYTRMIIVSDEHRRAEYEQKARRNAFAEIRDRVKFLGFRENIRDILSLFDVFALSSTMEGISLTLLEAMAAGKPVVATNVGGNPEVVEEGVTGFLSPAKEPVKLAAGIIKVLNNPELARRLGEKGKQRVEEKFSLEAMVLEYLKIYHEILE